MMEKHDEPTPPKENEFLRRAKIHKALIEFCYRKYGVPEQYRNDYGVKWIETYADNFFKQLEQTDEGLALIQKYERAGSDEERDSALEEIQKMLEKLNELNG